MHVLLAVVLGSVFLAALFFILVPRGPSKVDIVREKIRRGKERAAALDPLTGQLLVEPTENLRIPVHGSAVTVRVNLETAQKYRLHGLGSFRAAARSLSTEKGARVILIDEEGEDRESDPKDFYALMLGDGEFEEAFDLQVARIALIDRYADAFPGEREQDELMEECDQALEFADRVMAEVGPQNPKAAVASDFEDEPTQPTPMVFETGEPPELPEEVASARSSKSVDPFSDPEPEASGFDPFSSEK